MCRNWRPFSVAVEKIATKNLGADQSQETTAENEFVAIWQWMLSQKQQSEAADSMICVQRGWQTGTICIHLLSYAPPAQFVVWGCSKPCSQVPDPASQAACRTQPARIPAGQWLEIYGLQWSQGVDANIVRNPFFTGLVQGESYKKPPLLIGQLLVFCRFSLKWSQWFLPSRSKDQSGKKKNA